MVQVFKRPRFLLDLAEELIWLNREAGPEVAEHWYQALLATIDELRRQPHLGRSRSDLHPKGIRSWRVKRFSRWLIFYRVQQAKSLELLRVRSGAMDLAELELEN